MPAWFYSFYTRHDLFEDAVLFNFSVKLILVLLYCIFYLATLKSRAGYNYNRFLGTEKQFTLKKVGFQGVCLLLFQFKTVQIIALNDYQSI